MFNKTALKSLYNFASFLKSQGNFDEAGKLFNKIVSLKHKEDHGMKGGAFFHLGEINVKRGNKKIAERCFKKCLSHIPSHQKAKENIF